MCVGVFTGKQSTPSICLCPLFSSGYLNCSVTWKVIQRSPAWRQKYRQGELQRNLVGDTANKTSNTNFNIFNLYCRHDSECSEKGNSCMFMMHQVLVHNYDIRGP